MKDKIKIIVAIVALIIVTILMILWLGKEEPETQEKPKKQVEIAEIQIIDKNDKMKEVFANPEAEEYVETDIIIDGVRYYDVGVRTKGSTIYDVLKQTKRDNYSFKVKLNYKNKDQKYKRNDRNIFKCMFL